MNAELISINDALDSAFEIFYDMAEENLEEADKVRYEALFETSGAGMAIEAGAYWGPLINLDVDRNVFIEVQIGLISENVLSDVFVRMLLSRDPKQKECHILWKREGAFLEG